ncbi:Scr1 family TA system antitoxin-like transcriptional regulator [Plantactinospora sp. WMMC1484]|uniref:Scr1 family TA system antitoxin-like transcriptional regulator n=1 Tax=Plantactinospora sp. WMMC1484 TaxID=3404122 RepID=UPI003BF49306
MPSDRRRSSASGGLPAVEEEGAPLAREEPPALHVIVDEGVLPRVLGSRRVMVRQLHALLDAAERPTITLRVVPLAATSRATAVAGATPGIRRCARAV